QADNEVALVAFLEISSKAQPGSAGISRDAWIALEDLLDFLQFSVGFGQRSAWCGIVVEDKSPFVHARQKPSADPAVGEIATADEEEDRKPNEPRSRRQSVQQCAVAAPQPTLTAMLR